MSQPLSDSDSAAHAGVPESLHIGQVEVRPPILQAPMAGFSNFAYRHLIRRLGGVGLPATEMVSARGVLQMDKRGAPLHQRLWGVADEPRPISVQIWDNDPETLAEVGRRIARDLVASVVDLNFGCPVRDVSERAESGSYLLRDPERIGRIIERVAEACAPTPVTAKIRLGWTHEEITARDVAQAVEGAGGAALTVHGRTAKQFYRGEADWDAIANVRSALKSIPLIGNGDIRTPEAAALAFTKYGVDGVMVGRAGLGRPWFFSQIAAALRDEPIPDDPTPAEQRDFLLEQFAMLVERFGARKATVLMRKYACCYSQGMRGARTFRGEISKAMDEAEFRRIIATKFPGAPAVDDVD